MEEKGKRTVRRRGNRESSVWGALRKVRCEGNPLRKQAQARDRKRAKDSQSRKRT